MQSFCVSGSAVGHASWQRESCSVNAPVFDGSWSVNTQRVEWPARRVAHSESRIAWTWHKGVELCVCHSVGTFQV